MSATRKLETQRRLLREKCDRLEIEVTEMEVKMNIETRWTMNDKPFLDTLKYIAQRRYRRALALLEKLVVQRLFELHKMNLTHLGTCNFYMTFTYLCFHSLPCARPPGQGLIHALQGHPQGCREV